MFTVFECVSQQHDANLVLLAFLVGSLGCFTLFLLLDRSTDCLDSRRWFWIAVAGIAAGVGVWSTHFIAMLAYDGPMPLAFDPGLTISSVVVAILLFWAALKCVGREVTLKRAALGGGIAAAGVSAMHFTGMAAVVAPAIVRYDWAIVCAGYMLVLAAFVASFVAFGRLRSWKRIFIPASLGVAGVASFHFTAMAATTLVPAPGEVIRAVAETNDWLVPGIVAAAFTLVILASGGALLDRLLTDLRGIADATLEGLAIISGGRIVEANTQLGRLLGRAASDLIGTDPASWLSPSDGEPLDAPRTRPAEALIRRENGEELVVEIAPHMVEYRGRPCKVLAVRDLTDRKRAERQIEHLATHDSLTGLPNRVKFSATLDELALRKEPFALLALDLDRFKLVNDTFGHAAGDEVLRRVSGLLTANVRDLDLVARVGGDEFLIIQRGVTEAGARQLTTRLLRVFAELDAAHGGLAVGVSIGVALSPRDGETLADVRHHADVALYQAKEAGRGTACFFDRDLNRVVQERRQFERDLQHAIDSDELHLVYQPIVATVSRRVTGYEALLRWHHPLHGLVPPQTFIPIAEETGAIIQIGEWVLRTACAEASRWPDDVRIAVNVSAPQFALPDFADRIEDALSNAGLEPCRLELEVTESVMLRNGTLALATLRRLKAQGVRIVMDDFGTGYSSLSNLQAFPFDKIKIDRGFIGAMEHDEAALSIVRAVVGLGTSLRLPVVAEGVETEKQYELISREGCSEAQGYLFGAPSAPAHIQPRLRLVGGCVIGR